MDGLINQKLTGIRMSSITADKLPSNLSAVSQFSEEFKKKIK